jgi:homoserine O-acetyltransferase/O-succinyltransferase
VSAIPSSNPRPLDDRFDSDGARHARPLKHVQTVTFNDPLPLELGGELPSVTVAFETYGQLNGARDNAVLVGHAISGDSHVAMHDADDDPGWWDLVVGPGKYIDTDRHFVVCANLLGGCRGTTGPGSINPLSGRRYGHLFPTVTLGDMVEVERRLIDHLGIPTLRAVIGGSMGGHQALTWAVRFPERVRGVVAVATSARLTSQALAFDIVGRNAIRRDPQFRESGDDESGAPAVGLAIARMIGHITYLSREAMGRKFEADRLAPRDVTIEFEKTFSVGTYLGYQGEKFVERFDADSYLVLSMAMDLFDLGATPAELAAALGRARCRWLVVSFSSDWLFPPDQSRDIVNALIATGAPVSYCNVRSDCGHDAFLLPNDIDRYGELIRAFVANLGAEPGPVPGLEGAHDRIARLIPDGASVLDLGCGRGALLARLRREGGHTVAGVDIDEHAVLACVQRGLDVIHADLNEGLSAYADGQFDFVLLSLTLQAVRNVDAVLDEMLRVGRTGIVSFHNVAHHSARRRLAEEGRAPSSSSDPAKHDWHNTPHIRFLSIADFEEFCRIREIRIHRLIGLATATNTEVVGDPNRNADIAIFVIGRN